MTGEFAIDPANASFSGLFGTVTDQKWSPRWCDYFGVRPDWLPPVLSGDATLGKLTTSAAIDLGLDPGVDVKMGTADTTCAIIAAGMRPGEILHSVGTTQVVAALTDNPHPDPRRLTRLLGIGDSFLRVTHNPVGGAALDWLHATCFHEQSAHEFFEIAIPQAINRQTNVRLDPPYLGGDRLEIEPAYAGFQGVTVTTPREDLLAAVLIAMREQHSVVVRNLGIGTTVRRVYLTGGAADLVRKLIPEYAHADIVPVIEGAVRGVARLFRI